MIGIPNLHSGCFLCSPPEIKMYMTELAPYIKCLTTGHLVPVNI